jgi:hypothetical protein
MESYSSNQFRRTNIGVLSLELFLQLSDFVIELADLGSLFVLYRIDLTNKTVSKIVKDAYIDGHLADDGWQY